MKKMLVGLGVTMAALAGCTAGKDSADKGTDKIGGELTVVTNRTDADQLFDKMENDFIKKYPEVTDIKWESIADYDSAIMTRMTSGDYGDVLFVPFSMAGTPSEYPNFFESLGKASDLEKDYLDVTEADFDGESYGLPVALNSLGIIYNQELFDKAGIKDEPTTVKGFIEAAKKIKEETGEIPFYTNYQKVAIWAGALTSFGGEQFKSAALESGDGFAEGMAMRQVMDLFYALASQALIEVDPVTLDSQTAQQKLADGEIAMLMSGSQDVASIQSLSGEKDTIKIMNFPVEVDGKTSLPLGAPGVLGISNQSKNKATAKAFLDFFISAESGYAEESNGMTPVKSDLSKDQQATIDNSNVILTVATEKPEDEALYSKIAEEAGVARLTDVLQKVINIGLYPEQNESYTDYVSSLSETWKEAVKSNEG